MRLVLICPRPSGRLTIRDNGRGMPIENHPNTSIDSGSNYDNLHAGGKFSKPMPHQVDFMLLAHLS